MPFVPQLCLKRISFGVTLVLLFGICCLADKEKIITKQLKLIKTFKDEIHKVQRFTVQYVAYIEEYCELKAIDDSWFYLLTSSQKNYMNKLSNRLGLDEIPDVNVNVATAIVRQTSERILQMFSIEVQVLEDALFDMDIEKMKKLQEISMDQEELSSFSRTQMEQMKLEIISTSHEILARGILYKIASLFLGTMYEIAVPVAIKLFKYIIL